MSSSSVVAAVAGQKKRKPSSSVDDKVKTKRPPQPRPETPPPAPIVEDPEEDDAVDDDDENGGTAAEEQTVTLYAPADTTVSVARRPIEFKRGMKQDDFMYCFNHLYAQAIQNLEAGRPVYTNLPDMQLMTYLKNRHCHVHSLDFAWSTPEDERTEEQQFMIKNTFLVRDDKPLWVNGKKTKARDGVFNINWSQKYGQSMPGVAGGERKWGFMQVSAFMPVLPYVMPDCEGIYGPDEATGCNGNHGKEIKGNIITVGTEKYEFTCTNETWHHTIENSEYNNPIATAFMLNQEAQHIHAIKKLCEDPGCFTVIKKKIQEQWEALHAKDAKKKKYQPPTSDELAETILLSWDKCKVHKMKDAKDDSIYSASFNAAVFRRIRKDGSDANFVAPSLLFRQYTHNAKGEAFTKNDIVIFRARREDEPLPADGSDPDPWIEVPADEAILRPGVIAAFGFAVNEYEDKLDSAGDTLKVPAIFVLSDKKQLAELHTIKAVDASKFVPGAGCYHGAKNWLPHKPLNWVDPKKEAIDAASAAVAAHVPVMRTEGEYDGFGSINNE